MGTPTRDRTITLLPGAGSGRDRGGIAAGALMLALAAAALLGGSIMVTTRRQR